MENLIREWNTLSGLRDLPQAVAIERQRNQFAEETCEFWKAWRKGDEVEMLDGVADMMFVLESLQDLEAHLHPYWIKLGAMADMIYICNDTAGFHSDLVNEAYERVCHSNMTKFDDNEQDAIKTHHYHLAHNRPVETIERNGWYVCRLTEDVYGFGHKGKVLKSVNFKPVTLEDLI